MTKPGVIAALPAEASCFARRTVHPHQVISIDHTLLIVCGMGTENAAATTHEIIKHGATALVSWGTAGGLSDDLQAGDILIPELVQHDDGRLFQTHTMWRNDLINKLKPGLRLVSGILRQTPNVITSPQQKNLLHTETSAVAADMESATIAAIADQYQLPFLAIRSIVDPSDKVIPEAAISSIDEFGQTRIFTLITNLIKRPADIPELIKLGNQFNRARKSLKRVALIAGPNLAASANMTI